MDERLTQLKIKNPKEADRAVSLIMGGPDRALLNWHRHDRTWRKERLAALVKEYGDALDEIAGKPVSPQSRQRTPRPQQDRHHPRHVLAVRAVNARSGSSDRSKVVRRLKLGAWIVFGIAFPRSGRMGRHEPIHETVEFVEHNLDHSWVSSDSDLLHRNGAASEKLQRSLKSLQR